MKMTIDVSRSHYRVLFFILLLSSCARFSTAPKFLPERNIDTPVNMGNVQTPSADLEVYFTKPDDLHASDYEGGPDEEIAAAIDKARLSIDVAAYSLTLWSIKNALIHAYKRGVVVRIVMESDNMDTVEVQDIISAGIPVVGDQHEGLMHNKFIVIDRNQVWTGSMNFTVGGAYRDNNNIICIHSMLAAEDYTTEFEEMFNHHLFGADVAADTPYPKIKVGEIPVEIYFSPDDGIANRLVELLQNANSSIDFLAYSFTSDDLAAEIRYRFQNGVQVLGVMDDSQVKSNRGSEYDGFIQSGMDVRMDGNKIGFMHDKVIIIDREIVISGSYNFSASAEKINDENLIVIFSPEIAKKYLSEFSKLYFFASN
jgi:phosphatidylserine/phosphatidylglycerophosphate/cardiolipin synthase-like enzyme